MANSLAKVKAFLFVGIIFVFDANTTGFKHTCSLFKSKCFWLISNLVLTYIWSNVIKPIHTKGAFIDSLGRDYYVIGTAADIQVIVVHPSHHHHHKTKTPHTPDKDKEISTASNTQNNIVPLFINSTESSVLRTFPQFSSVLYSSLLVCKIQSQSQNLYVSHENTSVCCLGRLWRLGSGRCWH